MKLELMDKFNFHNTERIYTDEGYLIVPANIARPGIQMYRAGELKNNDGTILGNLDPEAIVNVYRPPEEVFNIEAVNSFKNIAVTNNHPPVFLNSKNHKKYSIGTVLSDVTITDGKFVGGTLKITDADTIAEINGGKVDVSAGYDSVVTLEEGETPSGKKYQAVQRNIRGNHVAVVLRGRAGSEIKISDGLEEPSAHRESLVSEGIEHSEVSEASETTFAKEGRKKGESEEEEVELGGDGVPGSNSTSPFSDSTTKTDTTVEDEVIDPEGENEMEDKEMELKDAIDKITSLESQIADMATKVMDQDKMDTMVMDRMALMGNCQRIHPKMEMTGKSNFMLKKEAVAMKLKDKDLDNVSQEYIDAAFDVMLADADYQASKVTDETLAEVITAPEPANITDNVDGKHDPDVYGEDLSFKDGEGDPETPKDADKSESVKETTPNTKEGINNKEGEADEVDPVTKEDKIENMDSSSILDSAFAIETTNKNVKRKVTAYEKFKASSRDAWKK